MTKSYSAGTRSNTITNKLYLAAPVPGLQDTIRLYVDNTHSVSFLGKLHLKMMPGNIYLSSNISDKVAIGAIMYLVGL